MKIGSDTNFVTEGGMGVVAMSTSGAASDDKVGIMKTSRVLMYSLPKNKYIRYEIWILLTFRLICIQGKGRHSNWWLDALTAVSASFMMADIKKRLVNRDRLESDRLGLSGKTSYRQMSWSLEATRLDVIMIVSLWDFTCISAARCLSIHLVAEALVPFPKNLEGNLKLPGLQSWSLKIYARIACILPHFRAL